MNGVIVKSINESADFINPTNINKMKTILQHNPAKQDNVEAMADALVESMRFADPTVDYPDISKA